MSVKSYTPDEIENLYADIQGLKPRIELIPDAEKLQMALWSALIANRAALAMSYGEDTVIPRCELPKGFNPKANPREVFTKVGLLLYNCISNGGRNFLPGKDKAVLDAVNKAIAVDFIERQAERKGVRQ